MSVLHDFCLRSSCSKRTVLLTIAVIGLLECFAHFGVLTLALWFRHSWVPCRSKYPCHLKCQRFDHLWCSCRHGGLQRWRERRISHTGLYEVISGGSESGGSFSISRQVNHLIAGSMRVPLLLLGSLAPQCIPKQLKFGKSDRMSDLRPNTSAQQQLDTRQ